MTFRLSHGARSSTERVILVDRNDLTIGSAEKLEAHRTGALHRACSVFVFNGAGELLLQRRAAVKYHSAGLWSNTCCGHPRPRERTVRAARRRLREEMRIDCDLEPTASMLYYAPLAHGLTEHEYDHIFVGRSDAVPDPDPTEVDAYRWQDLPTLLVEMRARPDRFTAWFGPALRALIERQRVDRIVGAANEAAVRRIVATLPPPAATVISIHS